MYFTFSESARKDVKKLPKSSQKRIKQKLEYWQRQTNCLVFAKATPQHKEASHRFRIGAYRVLVKQQGQELKILRIRHRKEVYQ